MAIMVTYKPSPKARPLFLSYQASAYLGKSDSSRYWLSRLINQDPTGGYLRDSKGNAKANHRMAIGG